MSECDGGDENGGPWIDVFPFEHDYHISEDEKEESYLVDAHFGYMNPDWTFT